MTNIWPRLAKLMQQVKTTLYPGHNSWVFNYFSDGNFNWSCFFWKEQSSNHPEVASGRNQYFNNIAKIVLNTNRNLK